LVCYEKTHSSYLALLHLAATIIAGEKLDLFTDKHLVKVSARFAVTGEFLPVAPLWAEVETGSTIL
jgi:hypothetical protein